MSDRPDNSNDRLEGLLRRWGAEEAQRTAQPPPMAAMVPARRAGAWAVLLRWGPLAAAAGLLVAAGGLFLAADLRSAAPPAGDRQVGALAPPATAPAVPPAFRQELDGLKALLAEARGKLDAETGRLGKEVEGLRDELRLRDTTVRAKETEIATLKTHLGLKDGEVDAAKAQAQAAREQMEALTKDKTALAAAAEEVPKLQEKLAALEARLKAAGEEIARAGSQREAVEAAYAKAQGELTLLKLRRGQAMSAFRQVYLAAAAPGETGLRALQTAARTRRLAERCAELQGQTPTESARRLLARLEVVLTRLDLLDADAPEATESFARLAAQGALAGEIDDVLAAGDQPPPVRNLLLEAGLILAGAEHAT